MHHPMQEVLRNSYKDRVQLNVSTSRNSAVMSSSTNVEVGELRLSVRRLPMPIRMV